MDVEFVGSVASVGDDVEIRLTFGDLLNGTLRELTATRLVMEQADGAEVALMLGVIAWMRRTGVTTRSAAEPTSSGSDRPTRVQHSNQVTSVHELEPPPDVRPEPDTTVAVKKHQDDEGEDPLETLARESLVPLRTKLTAANRSKRELESISNSLANAERIHELSPRHNRVPQLYHRAKALQRSDPQSADLFYLCGVLGLLNDDNMDAKPYLSTGADLSGDSECWRLLAIAAARTDDRESSVFALLNYFKVTPPNVHDPLWRLLLCILDRHGPGRAVLHELAIWATRQNEAAELVESALAGVHPPPEPLVRPSGASRRPFAGPRPHIVAGPAKQRPTKTAQARRTEDPYLWAKRLEHREKNLTGAKEAYREAIRQNVRVESAVKDLAWLTRRVDGATAALKVITEEYAGKVRRGDALDNLLIDFHIGARNYDDALVILKRQLHRTDITDSKRNHLQYQFAYVKFSAGLDSAKDWIDVLSINRSPAARRGLALALIRRGSLSDLAEAETVIAADTDEKADDIRRRIDQIRNGESSGMDPSWATQILGSLEQLVITPLVNFVMEHYSGNAATVREQRKRENKRPNADDAHRLAKTAHKLRGRARESSADSYISAAVIAWDAMRDEFQDYLCAGLTAVADVVLERQAPEAARGLYLEALRTSEGLEDPDRFQDTWLALSRFMCSLDGRRTLMPGSGRLDSSISKIISDQRDDHGDQVFDLITQLVSQVDVASDKVLEAVRDSEELTAAAVSYLTDKVECGDDLSSGEALTKAWRKLGERVAQEHPNAVAQLQFLQDVALSGDLLAATADRLVSLPDGILDAATVRRLADALQRLRIYLYEQAFEERETNLRRVAELTRLIQKDILQAPSRLSVEMVWPACEKIRHIVEDAQSQLLAHHPPEPDLTLGLIKSSVDKSGVITVQVKVGNRPGAAPLESPTLICRDDPTFFNAADPVVALPTAVRGGEYHIQVVRLKATQHAMTAGAFSLAVALEYKARASDRTEIYEVTLPIRVLSEADFQPIEPNPFHEGASGKVVDRPEMFVGRDDVIRRIFEHLDSAPTPGNGVAIFGQKRAGKSSIRLHLIRKLSLESDLVVVDLGNIGDFTPEKEESSSRKLIASLLWKILTLANEEIINRFGDRAPTGPLMADWTRAAFLEEFQPVSLFIDLMKNYLSQCHEHARPRLIVMIDEFQYFDEWIRLGLLSSSFMQSMKAIIERRLFHVVIVGQDAVERIIADNANVFGVFAKERVTYLAPEHAGLLIDRPIQAANQSRYRERAIERIIELTGGSAFYIQKFCYALVEYMNEQQTPLVTEADVELVRDRFLQSMRDADFDNLETAGYTNPDQPGSATYRKALQAIAAAARDGRADYDRVEEAYQGTAELRPLIEDLVLRDVIREEFGAYRIVVRAYQDWLLARTTQDSGVAR